MRNLIAKNSTTLITVVLILLANTLNAQSGWQLVHTDSGYFWDMSFVAGTDNSWETGWVLTTNSEILKTTDGGDTWTTITQTEATSLNGICFVDENTGFISSAQGKIIKSIDGGLTWSTNYSTATWLGQISFKDSQNGAVVGTPNMYTTDGGDTWQEATGPEDYGRIDYGGGDTYYASAILASAFGKSTDNGQTWTNTTLNNLPVVCDFFNETHGMTGGNNFTVMLTTDGGDTWTESELNNGQGDFLSGGYFDTDTIYAAGSQRIFMTTNAGVSWVEDTVITGRTFRSMFVTPTNVIYVGAEPGEIWRKKGVLPLLPLFDASDTLICSGNTVDFTDYSIYNVTSWEWNFEGGTPSTSTDQNPSVTYNTPGYYDVELTVSDGIKSETLIKTEYISVFETPAQAATPAGEANVCSGQFYTYSIDEIPYAQDYEWELSPTDVGTLDVDEFEASLVVDDEWTGDFTLKVRATNLCGDGEWSDDLEGTVYLSPSEFNLQGGGPFCEGGEGVEVMLDGSQTGIDYELYLDEETTGIIVEGTGSEISFGLFTEEGFYTAVASNDNCDVPMAEQVEVTVLPLPGVPASPIGPVAVCDETSSDYTSEGADNADSYIWQLTPEEAGSISGNGLEATVTWNSEFTGTATVSLAGVNECGEGDYSESLEITAGATIPEIIGNDLVCDWSDEVYEVTENEGSTYTWIITGGSIILGQGTYMVTVAWQGEGSGSITVEEENENGCEGTSEEFGVMIDDCTDINENLQSELKIYPNPAKNEINISINSDAGQDSRITIYNHLGLIVYKNIIAGQPNTITQKIDISSYTNGLYFMMVQFKDETILTKQLIKN